MYGTLRDNLLMAAPYASDEQMLHVASLTGVSDILARHPMGFGMPVGARGDPLSGRQKQAIALARALLAWPSVLLLDEPTSGMDMGSERPLMSALGPAMEGRTVIIVTHKPALLQFVERIVVMEDGVKVADGPKEQILQALNSGKNTFRYRAALCRQDMATHRDLRTLSSMMKFFRKSTFAVRDDRSSRWLILALGGVTLLAAAILWAACFQIEEVTTGTASVVPSSHEQVLQSFEGGILQELLVHEADVVQKG